MEDKYRSKEELVDELIKLRKRNDQLELYVKENRDNLKEIEDVLLNTKFLQDISLEIIYEDNINEIYKRLIDVARKIMHSDYASMQMLYDDKKNNPKLQLLATHGFSQEAIEFWEWVEVESGASTCGESLRTGKRIIATNVETCDFMQGTEDREVYLKTGIHAVQTTPLYSRSGKMLGMISTHWSKPYHPSERELRFLDVLARQAADIIEQKMAKEKLRESEEKYRTLFEYMNEGFLLAEIILDDSEKPIDYLFLDANDAFDNVTGLKHEEIIGKRKSEILESLDDLTEILGEVALTGKPTSIEILYEKLDSYFLIDVFSPKYGQFACLIQDITERRKLEKKVIYHKELFESVVENMHDALIIYDNEGKSEFINAEGRKLYKVLKKQEDSDKNYNNLENDILLKENKLKDLIFNGEKIRNERASIILADEIKYIEVNATPIFNDENNLKFSVVSYRDITESIENQIERKNNQEKILKAEKEKRESIEAAMRVKDEFLYLITHEFKTPITVISSVLQTIESLFKEYIPEKIEKYLNMIKLNTNRQLRLVNNLLDITRLNSGNIRVDKSNVDIVYISKSIVNSVEIYAKQKKINLNFTSIFENKEIYLDEEKFERIMLNLLSNSLKFTPSGKDINISIEEKKLENKKFISISIEDEGIGIPDEKQKLIFERFGQADTSLSRQAEGTGLGLYLVNILVNILDGKIELKSEPGKGSKFTILLPIITSLSKKEENYSGVDNQLMSSDERIIHATSIEFSDIYSD